MKKQILNILHRIVPESRFEINEQLNRLDKNDITRIEIMQWITYDEAANLIMKLINQQDGN